MTIKTRKFYDSVPVGVCIVRRDRLNMDIVYVNSALMQISSALGGALGVPFDQAWPSADAAKLVRELKSTTPPQDYILPAEEGDIEHWVKLTIGQDEFEGEDCFILWATDISSSKEAEAQLKAAVAQADAAAEMKANFLATMSHEIRTPMQTVFGLLELISEEKPEAKIKSMIDTAKTSASGLLEILDDILDLAKMDAAKMELDMFEVPVRTLARGILEALAVKVHGKNLELIDDIGQDVPFVVIGDPKRLRQILMNLAGNALKFTAKGSVTLRITSKTEHVPQPRRGVSLRFEIIDTGIGMSAEACSRMFQPFSQADNSTSRKFGGTGLGLSICKKLVELMGGQIGVSSAPGVGSTFWFEIPTEEVGTNATTVELPKLDGISVLSVEDHPQGAKEIVRSLESMGATVESCPTFKEGLELVKRRPFDVAIIDQGLPDGLGLDLIREITQLRPFMGLIMYTVRDDIGMQHTLNAMGVRYLAKPASRLGLGETIKDAARKTLRVGSSGPSRLLIAEDTESVRDILRRQLEKLGVEADFVGNGVEALKALESGKYGILFTDLHMPEMDGYQLAAEIRRMETEAEAMRKSTGETLSHLPVIVLTADVQMAQRQVYLSNGFDECLLKPVSLGQLRQLLIRWGLLGDETVQKPQEQSSGDTITTMPPSQDNLPPAIDVEKMKEQMGAVDENTIDMMHMFIDMTEPLIERLKTAHDHKDFHDLKEAAHSLKGGARSACCTVLGDIASQLQDDAEAEKPGCGNLVTQALAEFERVRVAVKNLKAA